MRQSPIGASPKPFGPWWPASYWVKWATISEAMLRLPITPPQSILDVGCGTGFTTVFLAEAGYQPTGIDVAPAAIAMASERAARWGVAAEFAVHDMNDFTLPSKFDAALIFDALHHSEQPERVVHNVFRHLRPGGWLLIGEPSWLHRISPHARRTSAERGWLERGMTARSLRKYCGRAGFITTRRFYEGTFPYSSRVREYVWQAIRLTAANFAVAPQASIWLAAKAPERDDPTER